jgi:hypothetical protein
VARAMATALDYNAATRIVNRTPLFHVAGAIDCCPLCRRLTGALAPRQEFDEFAAAVAILDQGMDLAGDQIDAGQQADRTVALVFVLAWEGRVHAGLGGRSGAVVGCPVSRRRR